MKETLGSLNSRKFVEGTRREKERQRRSVTRLQRRLKPGKLIEGT